MQGTVYVLFRSIAYAHTFERKLSIPNTWEITLCLQGIINEKSAQNS